ncbi:MAG: hypothetical protein MZV70_59850 [Desulfobacterales bacterium]|nr:hypothetical protein [Desulfobacterales bacterium]
MKEDPKEVNRLREIEEAVTREKGISPDTLCRLLGKVEEAAKPPGDRIA